jgi:hypothetical protein
MAMSVIRHKILRAAGDRIQACRGTNAPGVAAAGMRDALNGL